MLPVCPDSVLPPPALPCPTCLGDLPKFHWRLLLIIIIIVAAEGVACVLCFVCLLCAICVCMSPALFRLSGV